MPDNYREVCTCGSLLRISTARAPDGGHMTMTVQHGSGEARRAWPLVDVCTHGYADWLAEVHEYERHANRFRGATWCQG